MTVSQAYRRGGGTLALAALALATPLLTFWPVLGHLDRVIVGDAGDGLLNLWTLAWTYHVVDSGGSYFDAPLFFPVERALLFSEHLLGVAIVGYPLHRAGLSAVEVYNSLLIASFGLRVFTAGLLTLVVSGRWMAAGVAGILYGCSSFFIDHIYQLQVLSSAWIPLVFLFLFLALAEAEQPRPRWRRIQAWLCGLTVSFCLQGLSCNVYLVFLTLFVLGWLTAWTYRQSWRGARPLLSACLPWGVVTVLVFLPFVVSYGMVRHELGLTRSYVENVRFSAAITSILAAPPVNRIYGEWLSFLGKGEGFAFPGLTGLALLGLVLQRPACAVRRWVQIKPDWARGLIWYGCWLAFMVNDVAGLISIPGFESHKVRFHVPALFLYMGLYRSVRMDREAVMRDVRALRVLEFGAFRDRLFEIGLVLAWVLSWGPNVLLWRDQGTFGPGPYSLLYYLAAPLFWGIRTPARILALFVLFLGVAGGRRLAGYPAWVGGLAMMALLFEFQIREVPSAPVPTIPAVYETLAAESPGPTLILPIDEPYPAVYQNVRYMYYMTRSWFPMYGGYSGYFPSGYDQVWQAFHEFPRLPADAFDAVPEVRYLVVHARSDDEAAAARAVFEGRPGFRVLHQDGRDLLVARSGR